MVGNNNSFPLVKLPGISYKLDIVEYEYDNQIALSPTVVKGDGIGLKITFAMKNKLLFHNYNLHYQFYQCFYVR
jgi:hypothetical protein